MQLLSEFCLNKIVITILIVKVFDVVILDSSKYMSLTETTKALYKSME